MIFYLTGIIITFFLAVLLLSKKGKTAADAVLAVWLCLIGFHLFLYYGYITGDIFDYPNLLGIHMPIPLLHGPFLYVYTLTATRGSGFPKKYWIHLVPAAIGYIALWKFFLLSPTQKILVYKNFGAGYEKYIATIVIASMLSGFSYVALSFYELRKYRKRIAEEFSDTERINLNWLRYLNYGILCIWILVVIGRDPLIFGAVVIFVLLLGFFGIRHVGIFAYRDGVEKQTGKVEIGAIPARKQEMVSPLPVKKNSETPFPGDENLEPKENTLLLQSSSRVKYEKSGLSKEVADKIHSELVQLVNARKLFKQEELSLSQLAALLGVHPNILSQVINSYEKKSFYDYVNTLRVEEFKELALDPENSRYTLLSLAFECGFNSKTSFNRNFKKITGLSPSAYLKEINVELVNE